VPPAREIDRMPLTRYLVDLVLRPLKKRSTPS